MKQREYSELQREIMKVIGRLIRYLDYNPNVKAEIEQIKKDYHIEEPYLTLREYIGAKGCGAYHTFNFKLNGKNISIDTLGDMLTDEYCALYPLTNKYYVVGDERHENGGNCENYHCTHYLQLEPKED